MYKICNTKLCGLSSPRGVGIGSEAIEQALLLADPPSGSILVPSLSMWPTIYFSDEYFIYPPRKAWMHEARSLDSSLGDQSILQFHGRVARKATISSNEGNGFCRRLLRKRESRSPSTRTWRPQEACLTCTPLRSPKYHFFGKG